MSTTEFLRSPPDVRSMMTASVLFIVVEKEYVWRCG